MERTGKKAPPSCKEADVKQWKLHMKAGKQSDSIESGQEEGDGAAKQKLLWYYKLQDWITLHLLQASGICQHTSELFRVYDLMRMFPIQMVIKY